MFSSPVSILRLYWIVIIGSLNNIVPAEYSRELEISEGAPIGTRIGFIGDGYSGDNRPPYLIIPVQESSVVDNDLDIDQKTGEIRTKAPLDRESRPSYYFVAVPLNAPNIHVNIRVLDENDNAPTFPTQLMNVEFPENTPRDVKRTLHPARDPDVGLYSTQKYNIVSGNTNNAFKLSYHPEKDGVLYLDLQVNGILDRELVSSYSLLIEALDGGTPPLRGVMTVNVAIQDVNDNPPIFNQTRYSGSVLENATVGTSILNVYATDIDEGDNGLVEYSINRRQSDKECYFNVDANSGLVTVNKPLDFEVKEVHELVIVARDRGIQPLETTAFVSIRVIDVNDNQPIINLIFLSDDATPKIPEDAKAGEFVARISVSDPDSKAEYSNANVTLEGGDGHFGLTTRDSVVYLVIVALPLDREQKSNYTLSVIATDAGMPPLHASRTFDLRVTDVNDNVPEFSSSVYHANVLELAEPGTPVIQVTARDKDEATNGQLRYSIVQHHQPFLSTDEKRRTNNHPSSSASSYSSWFQIDPESGLITTRTHVDCELDPTPQLTVVATDGGQPALSSSATVSITIHDVNDNEPIFSRTFYNVTVSEDKPIGSCILQVQATDSDCGVNAMVNYTLQESRAKSRLGSVVSTAPIYIKSVSGEICISAELDYETRRFYEFTVIATDRGGLSAVSAVLIEVTDVNDNAPNFYPTEYKISLPYSSYHATASGSSSPAVIGLVRASDPDTGKYGSVSYRITSGSTDYFRVDGATGEIFILKSIKLSSISKEFTFNVSATDGAGLKSPKEAKVFVYLIDEPTVQFERSKYTFSVPEDVAVNYPIASVKLSTPQSANAMVRYFVIHGDPEGYFSIDPLSGTVKVTSVLDREKHHYLLLNIQATYGTTSDLAFTQALIIVEDKNDNAPEFESSTVRISVPENTPIGVPIYVARAADQDSGSNGVIHYYLNAASPTPASSVGGRIADSSLFKVNKADGSLVLCSGLDYESNQRHNLLIIATDDGQPTLTSNITVLLEVQDVNDNSPVFERSEYQVTVSESLPNNSKIIQVTAVDFDTGNNAKITYRLTRQSAVVDVGGQYGGGDESDEEEVMEDEEEEHFSMYANSGWLYLKKQLDREKRSAYVLQVTATDNGLPRNTASATVRVTVIDANDNAPVFTVSEYNFAVEENNGRGTVVGTVHATDIDVGLNAVVTYSLIPSNGTFQIDQHTGEISTREPLDREYKSSYELVAEAKDQGSPSKGSRASVRVTVTDVNDNAPAFIDPQEDVVSIREQQPPGIEVVRVRAIDPDDGYNASVSYSILKGRDTDGYGVFTIDTVSGMIRTRSVLDHEERTVYRIAVAATDGGQPPRQAVRILRIEVLDLNDNRPTFTSSSLNFKVREDVAVGYTVGNVIGAESSSQSNRGNTVYTLTYIGPSAISEKAFDIDHRSGWLLVAKPLDRESCSEYRLEVRAVDSGTNPQSVVIVIKVEILDVNDNAPRWSRNPFFIDVPEDTEPGSAIWNFTATDADLGANAELRYTLVNHRMASESIPFAVDSLTGALILTSPLDYESVRDYVLVIRATDQAVDPTDRLSASLTVRVALSDTNDNRPRIVAPEPPVVYISSSAGRGSFVCRVIAVDEDSGDNGRLNFAISSGAGNENSGHFSIAHDTGVVTVNKPFHKNSRATFVVNVTVSDAGYPVPLTSSVPLNISLRTASADNQLRFLQSVYHVNVSEDAPVGSAVISVSAHFNGYYNNYEADRLFYYIPANVANDTFAVDKRDGLVSLRKSLDRETEDEYTVPVYVSESRSKKSDFAVIIVHVSDVNDNKPSFKSGSCYPLWIPENAYNDSSLTVHTVVAFDRDSESNSKILYSITGGNVGNKFNIDPHSGDLSCSPLDRESQSKYHLTISAQDQGVNPNPLVGFCNVTIHVEDENDNEPQFEKSVYRVSIPEDTAVGSTVLTVKAFDIDTGINAQIVYILHNESDWIFRIHNRTGVIVLAGELDREKQSFYSFQVLAMDTAHYRCLSQATSVQITVEDVNDNSPKFVKYPFVATNVSPHLYPGAEIVKISAIDADSGANAELTYRFVNERHSSKFRLNPNNGMISAFTGLSMDAGKVFYLEVVAFDKGNPPLSSTGLVEIKIADNSDTTVALRFQNSSYDVYMDENSPAGNTILQVFALRSDGRKQKIIYSFGCGNEDGAFEIHQYSGSIRIKNSSVLDFEINRKLSLVIVAETEDSSGSSLYAFADLFVHLIDQNDNAPMFTQDQYFATIPEGNPKSTFVLQVLAIDVDESFNSKISYHIVDGNHDNAFVIEPPASNIVKTNIVLDAEIRDTYKITVIATDEGVPQMTGTSTIRINVIDVNDNQPSFPPYSPVKVSEYAHVGSTLTTVTANDVDSYPPLVYAIDEFSDETVASVFAIDRYSGRLILKSPLDYEVKTEYKLSITASDGLYVARTSLLIHVIDENDNAPTFSQLFYQFILPEDTFVHVNANDMNTMIAVSATDLDSGENGRISYSIVSPVTGFSVDKITGFIYANRTLIEQQTPYQGYFDLLIKATDNGKPTALSSIVSVRFETRYNFRELSSFSPQSEYRISIKEGISKGKVILNLGSNYSGADGLQYSIIDGNENDRFEILSPKGDLMLVQPVDRETRDIYSLRIAVGEDKMNAALVVHIVIEDSNDNAPRFSDFSDIVSVPENVPLDYTVLLISATDDDLPPNSDVRYEISSGNDEQLFSLHPTTGMLSVTKQLDYDVGPVEYVLVVSATDNPKSDDRPLTTIKTVNVSLKDENDNSPMFPVSEYLEFIAENEPFGTSVFTARATDYDRGIYGRLNYSIVSAAASGFADVDDSWKLFKIDPQSGLVTSNSVFDYESRSRYAFTILCCDIGGKCAKVKTKVEIEGKDEFHPQFTERTYRFLMYGEPVVGHVIGQVTATDRDKGPDGRVVYQLTTQNPYFKINRTSGAVMIKKKFDANLQQFNQDISLVVTASSGRQGSLTNISVVEIVLDPSSVASVNLASNSVASSSSAASGQGIANWLISLLVVFVLIGFGAGLAALVMHVRKRKRKIGRRAHGKSPNHHLNSVGRVDYVDPTAFDTIPIRSSVIGPPSQFGPPKYDEIPTYRNGGTNNGQNATGGSNSAAQTTSELSASEQSGSSGRGSAEDAEDEDEEIRMINEGQNHHRQHRTDDDNLSDVSVHNTQEYLARLGIVDSQNSNNINRRSSDDQSRPQKQRVNVFAEEDEEEEEEAANTDEADITNIIYAKLNDVNGVAVDPSSSASSASARIVRKEHPEQRNSSNSGRIPSSTSVDHHGVLNGYSQVPSVAGTQPSMSGSLSSIIHSEEELTGSYNWDYLLDWGPQYQPLAHVFSEIARLKDDAASVKSGTSGTTSSSKSKSIAGKSVPPPMLTNVAPRSAVAPILSNRAQSGPPQHSSTPHHKNQMLLLPRSPISHDTVSEFSTSAAMSPSFSPSLSPLATRSPSNSPLHLHSIAPNANSTTNSIPHIRKRHHHSNNENDIQI